MPAWSAYLSDKMRGTLADQAICVWRALLLTVTLSLVFGSGATRAQAAGAPALIKVSIDETKRVRLLGNTRPEATAIHDRGRVADSLPMPHLQLLLKRSTQRERAAGQYVEQLHSRSSANFHHWLTPADVALRFGPSPQDIGAVSSWLRLHNFTVNAVSAAQLTIDFSGTAGDVRSAFHTEIHKLDVAGERHFANMQDPEIPAALEPAVAGIVSLHDFRPHPLNRPRAQYSVSTTTTLISPADLATIYNFTPLFAKGTSGQNQTVVVIENTDLYNTGDWSTFRSTFGLAGFTAGTLVQVHPAPPTGPNTCTPPGVVAASVFEATLDAEWASAAAPSSTIEVASCADTTNFGGFIALQNLLNQSATPPAIVSISYGQCEALNGAAGNAYINGLYQQAVMEGVSIFVAAGDQGAASCDYNAKFATRGIGVSGFASTPYNVAVGGTDFGDTYQGLGGTYWSSTNTTAYGSALSYIPEIPWNYSCASALLSAYYGYPAPYGATGFCNAGTALSQAHLSDLAGGGGPSACASGVPVVADVVGGSCVGYRKPLWQSGIPGIPADGVRDLPDVSLFAANGVWGHYYVTCFSDTAAGGAACTGAPSGWSGGGGTSFAAPILAGIQALVNQSAGARQGNPDPVYYSLAASQFASGINCNSSSGKGASGGCVFYDVTQGDIDVDCTGMVNCYLPSATYGSLSTNVTAYSKAYAAGSGWDFASGIGSVNTTNLVQFWTAADISLTVSGQVSLNNSVSYALTIGNAGPQSAAAVVVTTAVPSGFTLVAAASSAGCTQTGQTITCNVGTVAVGAIATVSVALKSNGSPPNINITFVASSNNPDLNPAAASAPIALSLTAGTTDTDAPLPPWAIGLLGVMLVMLASRRLNSGAHV